MAKSWYIARIKSGFSREAKERLDKDGNPREPDRVGESRIERSLRDEGFECYFPSMRKDIVHHRTKKRIAKRFPLFTGYIFVQCEYAATSKAKDCDGVSEVLGIGVGEDRKPWPLEASIVEGLRHQEGDLIFDDTETARIKRREQGRTRKETIKLTFVEGLPVRVKKDWQHEHMFSGFHGQVVSVTGRGTVKTMMEIFGNLVPVEIEASFLEPAGSKAA